MDSKKITQQLNKLPLEPGVYIFKDASRKILYIGKAAKLRNRVKSYFQNAATLELRLQSMVNQIFKIDFLKTESEISALVLESEMIKRYKPKYNIEWKDDKNFLYIKIAKERFPYIKEVRPPLEQDATYLGPFTDAGAVRKTLKFLRVIFPYRTCQKLPQKPCLFYYINRCGAPCIGNISEKEYSANLKKIILFIKGKQKSIILGLEKDMKKASKNEEFEKAAFLRDQIENLKRVKDLKVFYDEEKSFIKSDEALTSLTKILNLPAIPRRIEAYDVSNIFGKQATGSMVVFQDGLPFKNEYKRFKIRTVSGINDIAMISEVLRRRFKQSWILPDLIIVDGGKGQLGGVLSVLKQLGLKIPTIGLAKRNEEIIIKQKEYGVIRLKKDEKALHLIQRIRDEAHRFAIFYHEKLRTKLVKKSLLDEIFGIGTKNKKKLLKSFGSIENIKKTNISDLAKIVGDKKAKTLKSFLKKSI